jgi:hypothetical protein
MNELFLSVLAGIVSHQSNHILRKWQRNGTGEAWVNLSRMGIGVVAVLPIYALIRGNSGEELKRDVTAYLSAFSSFGIGVAVGYLLDE